MKTHTSWIRYLQEPPQLKFNTVQDRLLVLTNLETPRGFEYYRNRKRNLAQSEFGLSLGSYQPPAPLQKEMRDVNKTAKIICEEDDSSNSGTADGAAAAIVNQEGNEAGPTRESAYALNDTQLAREKNDGYVPLSQDPWGDYIDLQLGKYALPRAGEMRASSQIETQKGNAVISSGIAPQSISCFKTNTTTSSKFAVEDPLDTTLQQQQQQQNKYAQHQLHGAEDFASSRFLADDLNNDQMNEDNGGQQVHKPTDKATDIVGLGDSLKEKHNVQPQCSDAWGSLRRDSNKTGHSKTMPANLESLMQEKEPSSGPGNNSRPRKKAAKNASAGQTRNVRTQPASSRLDIFKPVASPPGAVGRSQSGQRPSYSTTQHSQDIKRIRKEQRTKKRSSTPSRKKETSSAPPEGEKSGSFQIMASEKQSFERLDARHFTGLETLRVANAGATRAGLVAAVEACTGASALGVGFCWFQGGEEGGGSLGGEEGAGGGGRFFSTNFSDTSAKRCVPSRPCHRWHCPCGRTPRCSRATAPCLGALLVPGGGGAAAAAAAVAAEGGEGRAPPPLQKEGPRAYLLPLHYCQEEIDSQNSVASTNITSHVLPFDSETTLGERWNALTELLRGNSKSKVVFHAQAALMPLVSRALRGGAGAAPRLPGLLDPKVAAYVLNTDLTEQDLEFENLVARHLGEEALAGLLREEEEQARGGCTGPGARAIGSLLLRVEAAHLLAVKMGEAVHRLGLRRPLMGVDMPLVPVLCMMEVTGIRFLPDYCSQLSRHMMAKIQELEKEVAQYSSKPDFNVASAEQVAGLLYGDLGLPAPPVPAGRKHPSTGEEILQQLQDQHPAVAAVLGHRALNKVKTAFTDSLPAHKIREAICYKAIFEALEEENGDQEEETTEDCFPMHTAEKFRLHPNWNQCSARTGRLSCSKPGLQQIPKNSLSEMDGLGFNIRDAFRSSNDEYTLVAADYSQIEMRVMAHCCQDPNLLSVFQEKRDVYAAVAARVFGAAAPEEISPDQRAKAKTVCLGIIYGMGPQQASKRLKIPVKEARELIDKFLASYPRINEFCRKAKAFVLKSGYVETLTGRRRYLHHIAAQTDERRRQAERQAVNSIIQGSASDILKLAMLAVNRHLREHWESGGDPKGNNQRSFDKQTGQEEEGGLSPSSSHPSYPIPRPRLLLTIHDELVFECPSSEEDMARFKKMLTSTMQEEVPKLIGMHIDLPINMSVGISWGSMRSVL